MMVCTLSLLFIMLSFTAVTNYADREQMGLDINGYSLWNILRFPPNEKLTVDLMP